MPKQSPKTDTHDRGRFSARRKTEAVLRLLRGEDLDALSRELGDAAATLSAWRDAFLDGGTAAMKRRPADDRDELVARLQAKVGQLTMDNELLGTRCQHLEYGPAARRREAGHLSRSASPGTGKPYGLQRVCRIFGLARSTAYYLKAREAVPPGREAPPKKRGPVRAATDDDLVDPNHCRGWDVPRWSY